GPLRDRRRHRRRDRRLDDRRALRAADRRVAADRRLLRDDGHQPGDRADAVGARRRAVRHAHAGDAQGRAEGVLRPPDAPRTGSALVTRYAPLSPGITVNGSTLFVLLDFVRSFSVLRALMLETLGVERIDPTSWYPQE